MQDTTWTLWVVRVLVIAAALAAWYWSQKLLGQRQAPEAHIDDRVHAWTASLNRALHAHPRRANGVLIVSSAMIDLLGLFLLASSILGPTFRPFLGLFILFLLRQICQATTSLPMPRGAIWHDPGFPTLLVTYGTAGDLFFSGHTAIAVYGAIELSRLGDPLWTLLGLFVATFEILIVLVLRAHYTMDVYAGIVTALWVAGVAEVVASIADQTLSSLTGM